MAANIGSLDLAAARADYFCRGLYGASGVLGSNRISCSTTGRGICADLHDRDIVIGFLVLAPQRNHCHHYEGKESRSCVLTDEHHEVVKYRPVNVVPSTFDNTLL